MVAGSIAGSWKQCHSPMNTANLMTLATGYPGSMLRVDRLRLAVTVRARQETSKARRLLLLLSCRCDWQSSKISKPREVVKCQSGESSNPSECSCKHSAGCYALLCMKVCWLSFARSLSISAAVAF